jgi:hypothetical protein
MSVSALCGYFNSCGKPAVPVLWKFSKSERIAGSGYFRNVKEPTVFAKELANNQRFS